MWERNTTRVTKTTNSYDPPLHTHTHTFNDCMSVVLASFLVCSCASACILTSAVCLQFLTQFQSPHVSYIYKKIELGSSSTVSYLFLGPYTKVKIFQDNRKGRVITKTQFLSRNDAILWPFFARFGFLNFQL